MYIYKELVAGQDVLYLEISTRSEQNLINEFTQVDKPLTATLKKNASFVHPHIEIRKVES